MIVAAPGLAPAVCETPVDLLDLFPTLLTAAGVDPSSDMQDRPGQSLFDIAATMGAGGATPVPAQALPAKALTATLLGPLD
jgi:arylsulfatase A-like enzyme